MAIHQRLSELIVKLEETPAGFSEKLGIQRSSLSHLLSARNKPSIDFLEKLLHVYPLVNLTWLVTGNGEMIVDNQPFSKNVDNVHENEPSDFVLHGNSQVVKSEGVGNKIIHKIVWFYRDGTFEVYHPSY